MIGHTAFIMQEGVTKPKARAVTLLLCYNYNRSSRFLRDLVAQ